jgi:hypothetical protein
MATVLLAKIGPNLKPGSFILSEYGTKIYLVNEYGTPEVISDTYIGANQPLANIKVWHDTINNITKYNTGIEWIEVKSEVVDKNFGTF